MTKRVLDIAASLTAMVVLSPVFLMAAIGVRLSSRGPTLFRAKRVGRNGELFTMHKFRTMRVEQEANASRVTAANDPRVFAFGDLLRRLKIDELPQLFDVLRGKMSIVGPRPEDVKFVHGHYAPEHLETLAARPGLASPGGIYHYTHVENQMSTADPERDYLETSLPMKLALELVYVRNESLLYDLRIIVRTVVVIVAKALGKRRFRDPPEMSQVVQVVPALSRNETKESVCVQNS